MAVSFKVLYVQQNHLLHKDITFIMADERTAFQEQNTQVQCSNNGFFLFPHAHIVTYESLACLMERAQWKVQDSFVVLSSHEKLCSSWRLRVRQNCQEFTLTLKNGLNAYPPTRFLFKRQYYYDIWL